MTVEDRLKNMVKVFATMGAGDRGVEAGVSRAGVLEAGVFGAGAGHSLLAAARGIEQRQPALAASLLMLQLEMAVESRTRKLTHLRSRPRDTRGRVVACVADETVRAYVWMIEQIPLPDVLERAKDLAHLNMSDIELLYA